MDKDTMITALTNENAHLQKLVDTYRKQNKELSEMVMKLLKDARKDRQQQEREG